jgi:N-acetylglucosaminyldiphosphoundecaprenol N-acetyl-beta-D-mannosaminyltransferase
MRRFGYQSAAESRWSWLDQFRFGVSYAAHLAAVLAVNPRRAAVQARAIARPGSVATLFRRLRQADPARRSTDPGTTHDGERSTRMVTADYDDSRPTGGVVREFIGLRFWDVSLPQAAQFVIERANQGVRTQVFFVNAHCINQAASHPGYASLLSEAPFLFADGVGMAIAARFSGTRLEHNVNGTDLFPLICEAAAAAVVPVAFLGARPGVARACADRMQAMYPGLRVVWTDHGYLDPEQEQGRLHGLNASGARILFVAKGVPAQECWIAEHAERLAAPVVLGVGALFDFYSGNVPRAPRVVRDLRGEWVYRLLLEPRRMSRRYLLGNPTFIARMLIWRSLSQPLARRGGGST